MSGFKDLLEVDNIFGQKKTSFELLNLEDTVDEDVFKDLLHGEQLRLTLGGAYVSDLIRNDAATFAAIKVKNDSELKGQKYKFMVQITSLKYTPKDEALYVGYRIMVGTPARSHDKPSRVYVKIVYDVEVDNEPNLDYVKLEKTKITVDDIDLANIVPFSPSVVKSIFVVSPQKPKS